MVFYVLIHLKREDESDEYNAGQITEDLAEISRDLYTVQTVQISNTMLERSRKISRDL